MSYDVREMVAIWYFLLTRAFSVAALSVRVFFQVLRDLRGV